VSTLATTRGYTQRCVGELVAEGKRRHPWAAIAVRGASEVHAFDVFHGAGVDSAPIRGGLGEESSQGGANRVGDGFGGADVAGMVVGVGFGNGPIGLGGAGKYDA
jgi:hypothetical protein